MKSCNIWSFVVLFSRFIQVVVYVSTSFLFIVEKCHILHHISFIHSLVGGHLSCFHFRTIMNMNINIQVFVWMYIFISLGYIARSGITRLCGNFILTLWGTARLCFPKSLHYVTFLLAAYSSFNFSISSTKLTIICLFIGLPRWQK